MKNTFRQIIAIGLVLGLAGFSVHEDDFLAKIVAKYEAFQAGFPQEKAYLHFDKPYYSLGENVWFSAYLFDGTLNVPDTISKIIYVDFIRGDKVITQQRLQPSDGVADGSFFLADSLGEGTYQIRAYTNWMKNFDEAYLFSREFKVYQPDKTPPVPEKAVEQLRFDFFPESGQLVEGIESRMGFKATNQFGKGTDVEGFVLSNSGDTVASFQSEHLGLGRFLFTPETGKNYVAHVKSGNSRSTAPLPAAKAKGQVMIVDNLVNKDFVKVYVFNNDPAPAEQAKEFGLVVHLNGQVCFAAKGSAAKRSFVANIPKNRFTGEGVASVTLFNPDSKPVAERIIFVKKDDNRLKVSISPNKTTYKPREKVSLDITVTDASGQPVVGDFSLAATDGSLVTTPPNSENIVSYLLMSSDIKGVIEQPGYYFNTANRSANQYLDYLMMTQGWRRYTWESILGDQAFNPRHFIEESAGFSGTVLRPNGKPQEKEVRLTMYVTQGGSRSVLTTTASKEGRFGFYTLEEYKDTMSVVIQAEAGKANRNLIIRLDEGERPKVIVNQTPFNPIELDPDEFTAYLRRAKEYSELEKKLLLDKVKILDEVQIKAKRNTEDPNNRKIYGSADAVVKFDEQTTAGALNIFQVIQGKVAGVSVSGSGMNYTVQIRGATNFSGAIEPAFLLDGIQVDAGAVSMIPPNDVDYVDVIKRPTAIFGSAGSGGVIAIYTKRGTGNYDWSKDVAPGQLVAKIRGYERKKEFFSPNYDVARPEHIRPDYRSTLYWAPRIRADAAGKARVSFWNTDNATTVDISLEGTTPNGKLATASQSYTVK